MPTILITGASRGIGFALAQSYINDGWHVLGTRRNPRDELPKGVEAITLDITSTESIQGLTETLYKLPIDLLWNNAGAYFDKNINLQNLTNADWIRSFEVNTIAPIRIAEDLILNTAVES